MCGTEDFDVLVFDHMIPAEKKYNIACMNGAREQRFWTEVEKCRLLCANCHLKHTKQQHRERSLPQYSHELVDREVVVWEVVSSLEVQLVEGPASFCKPLAQPFHDMGSGSSAWSVTIKKIKQYVLSYLHPALRILGHT